MRLTIKYFGSIREHIGIAQETFDLEPCGMSLNQIRTELASRSERRAEALAADRPVRTAVNMQMVPGSLIVREDCEVAFFPPVTGG